MIPSKNKTIAVTKQSEATNYQKEILVKGLDFSIYLISGMCEEPFSSAIMVGKPYARIDTSFTWKELSKQGIRHVSDLIKQVKVTNPDLENRIGSPGMENFCYQNIYLTWNDYLVGLQEDNLLTDIYEDFRTDSLSFVHLYVAGGASLQYMGFRFDVHLSREGIHAHDPHVHVIHDDVSVRYSLETFERYPQDNPSRIHDQYEKKRIRPFLEKNKDKLMEFWNLAMKGYLPPQIVEDGRQYCKEA